jgi:integrase
MAQALGEIPAAWAASMDDFRDHLIVSGRMAGTLDIRLYQMARFTRAYSAGPAATQPQDVVRYLARGDWAQSTRQVVRATLVAYFRWAVKSGLITSDPTSSLPVEKAPAWTPQPATRAEINAAIKKSDPEVALMIRLSADAGLSAMEISTVRPRDVQENDGDYFVRTIGKANRVKLVPLPPSLAEEIKRSPDEYLFPGQIDGHMSKQYIGRRISQAFPSGISSEKVRQAFSTSGTGHRVASWRAAAFHPVDDASIFGGPEVAEVRSVQKSLRRIERFMESDPATAISESKNILESMFKQVLDERGALPDGYVPLVPLFERVVIALDLKSSSVPDNPDASEEIERILTGLVTTVSGINRTRNELGTGHGQHDASDPDTRHARLVFNATVSVAEFLSSTLEELRGAGDG